MDYTFVEYLVSVFQLPGQADWLPGGEIDDGWSRINHEYCDRFLIDSKAMPRHFQLVPSVPAASSSAILPSQKPLP